MLDVLLRKRGPNGNATPVEQILSEIPFFAVGILAFGVMTFLLAMRRINLHTVYLYVAILLAFSGGILDLAQILAHGLDNVDPGLTGSVQGIIDTREVAFAFSLGFRLLFYWTFVAICPRREQPQTPDSNQIHSASWSRWGVQGVVLQWITFVLIIVTTVLQFVWRISLQHRVYGTVYLADTALGIVTALTFLLKLLLNTYLSPHSLLQFRSYAAPMVALIFSISVGIGNAVSFTFSETTLGRLLQAVEFYILVEYLLISTFYRSPGERPSTPPKGNLATLTFDEKLINKEMPPTPPPPLPKSPTIASKRRPSSSSSKLNRLSRSASRLSTWVASRGNNRRPTSGEHLWDQGKAELGLGLVDSKLSARADVETPDIISPLVQEALVYQQSHPPSQTSLPLPPPTVEGPHSVVEEVPRVPPLPPNLLPASTLPPLNLKLTPPALTRDSVDISSYYAQSRSPSPLEPPRRPLPATQTGTDFLVLDEGNRSNRSSIVNEAFDRQQRDLDKSIAALRQFSPEMRTLKPTLTTPIASRRASASESLSTKPDSASASVFSLSNLNDFPTPPEDDTRTLPGRTPKSRVSTIRSVRTVRQRGISQPPPMELPLVTQSSQDNRSHTLDEENPTPWLGSAGTQYDVTSFIGGFLPQTGVLQSGSVLNSSNPVGSATSIPGVQEQYFRDLGRRPVLRPPLRPLLLAPSADPGLSAQSAVIYTSQNDVDLPVAPPQPLSSAPFNGRNGLPPRPRIAGPRTSVRSPPSTRPPLPIPGVVPR